MKSISSPVIGLFPRWWIALFIGLVGLPSVAGAQKVGGELWLQQTTDYIKDASVSVASDGDFIVVWDDGTNVFGRLFTSSGAPITGKFRVNTIDITDVHLAASVAAAPDGRFVVAWCRHVYGTIATFSIYFRIYDENGLPLAPETRVSREAIDPNFPDVVVAPDGTFVIVWSDLGWSPTRPAIIDGEVIRGQRFDQEGVPIGSEFEVNTTRLEIPWNPDERERPSLAGDSSGNFVVVWGRLSAIVGRRYDAAANALGDEFEIATIGIPDKPFVFVQEPDVAVASNGEFIVVWEEISYFDFWGPKVATVQGRRYSAAGAPSSRQFHVANSYGFSVNPIAAIDSFGRSVVVWQSSCFPVGAPCPGPDADTGISARLFSAGGAPIGDEFLVNSFTFMTQAFPAVAATPPNTGGDATPNPFIVVWDTSNTDQIMPSLISAQRLGMPADLYIYNMWTTEAAAPGGTIEFGAVTWNQHGAPAGRTFTEFRWSSDPVLDGADTRLGAVETVAWLDPDDWQSGPIQRVTLPPVAPGIFTVFAVADAFDNILEADETNNTMSRTVVVGPDLLISNLSAPSPAFRGHAFAIEDVTWNRGGSPTPSTQTRLVLSRDSILGDEDDLVLANRIVPPLPAGRISIGSTMIVIPLTVTAGYYRVFAISDVGNVVQEASDTNNRSSVLIRVY